METFTHTLDPYEKRVFEYLKNLKPRTTIVLDELVEKINMKKFIETAKKYMRLHAYIYMDGLEFSNDYTKLKKQEL